MPGAVPLAAAVTIRCCDHHPVTLVLLCRLGSPLIPRPQGKDPQTPSHLPPPPPQVLGLAPQPDGTVAEEDLKTAYRRWVRAGSH